MNENEILFILSFACMFTFFIGVGLAGTRLGMWLRDDILRDKDDDILQNKDNNDEPNET